MTRAVRGVEAGLKMSFCVFTVFFRNKSGVISLSRKDIAWSKEKLSVYCEKKEHVSRGERLR